MNNDGFPMHPQKLDTVSKEQLQQKLDGTRRGGAALFLLFLFAVSMSVLQTTQVKLQVGGFNWQRSALLAL